VGDRFRSRLGAASFFLLAPYLLYEAIDRLITGAHVDAEPLAIALTASSVAPEPLLGFAKLRLGPAPWLRRHRRRGRSEFSCALPRRSLR
jgi:hypothetical protein